MGRSDGTALATDALATDALATDAPGKLPAVPSIYYT